MSNQLRAHVALFAINLLYGANYVVAKGLMPNIIGANGFILLRVIGAVLLFWLIFIFRFQKIAKADILSLIFCGLFGVAVNQLFFFNGLMLTSPINAPVIMTTTPIIVLVLSLIFLKEKMRSTQIIGVFMGALGAVLFSLQNIDGGFATGIGDLFIFFNAASYAIYLILVKPLMSKYNALTVITWVFTFGLIFVLSWPFTSIEFAQVQWNQIATTNAFRMLFVVIGVTFLPYLLQVYAMKTVSPSMASVYIYLQPILSGAFVYLLFYFGFEDYTRDISMIKLLSAIIIFVGVYLVIKPNKVVEKI